MFNRKKTMKKTNRHILFLMLYIACFFVVISATAYVIGEDIETERELAISLVGLALSYILLFKTFSRLVAILVEKKKERLERLGESTESLNGSPSELFRRNGFDLLVRPLLKKESVPYLIIFFLSLLLISFLFPSEGALEIVMLAIGCAGLTVSALHIEKKITEAALPKRDETDDCKEDSDV